MSSEKAEYKQPMQPWPMLVDFCKQTKLPMNDLEIFYYEAGTLNQKCLLMLHGLGDEADTWRHVFLPLSTFFHVYALDLPGFGRSSKPDIDYTPQFFMGSIIEFLDIMEIKKTLIMGSSLGGILAHVLAVSHPDRVISLILVGGAVLQTEPMGDWRLRLMQMPLLGEWLYTRLRKDADAAFNSLGNVYHDLDSLPKVDRDFLFNRVNQRVWSNGQRRGYFSTLRNLRPWMKKLQINLPNQLKGLDIPTFVVRGEFDPLYSEINAKKVVAIQPKAKLAMVKNAGHLPHQENPSSFMQTIEPWIRDQG
jgi:pimeloyl-ACP methyl ester carboxylesterase